MKKPHSMWGLGLAILLSITSHAWEVMWRSADVLQKKSLVLCWRDSRLMEGWEARRAGRIKIHEQQSNN